MRKVVKEEGRRSCRGAGVELQGEGERRRRVLEGGFRSPEERHDAGVRREA